jgi:MFS family permease
VFYLGTSITALFIPVVFFLVPESVHWMTRKQPAGALEKINHILRKCKKDVIGALPQITEEVRKKSAGDIFSPKLLKTTMIIAVSYFFHITTYYFILKWVPKIVADLGFAHSSAGSVLVWANVGGALGGTLFGLLTLKFDLKKMSVGILLLAGIFVAVFGHSPADLKIMSFLCVLAGFFGNTGITALYTVNAHAYPTHARAFGIGFMLTVGRGGAILSPILVGHLLATGVPLPSIGNIMGIGSVVSAAVLLFLKLESGDLRDAAQSAQSEPARKTA